MKFIDLLDEKKLTIYHLSKISKIPLSTLFDIKSGKSNIFNCKGSILLKLSKTLNVTIEQLLSLEYQPYNKAYEENIPIFLKHSLTQYKKGIKTKNTLLDCYFMELNSDINVAEVENLITKEQATYLRNKYLWD